MGMIRRILGLFVLPLFLVAGQAAVPVDAFAKTKSSAKAKSGKKGAKRKAGSKSAKGKSKRGSRSKSRATPAKARVVVRRPAAPARVTTGQVMPQTVSQPVVQPLPSPETMALNSALSQLGKDPNDVNAMVDAGNAALALGDVDAAAGFFARADQLQPNSPRVKAGLAGALVRSGNPYDAIPLFAEAEAAGGMDMRLNGERGLAYDLVGDNASAQRYYRAALAVEPSDEISRRLAISQAIAGDRTAMELTLAPMLQRQDRAAWRVRAFGLAILGRSEEAVTIASQSMPPDLASGIAPYLRYMPRLTRAQQAAAANFGQFPRASEIGRDDPRVARFAPPARVATADSALVPKGEPLGTKARKGKNAPDEGKQQGKSGEASRLSAANRSQAQVAPRAAPPELQPRREQSETPSAIVTKEREVAPQPARAAPPSVQVAVATPPRPAPPAPRAASAELPALASSQPVLAQPAPTQPAPTQSAPAQTAPALSGQLTATQFDLASAGRAQPTASTPTPTPTPARAPQAAPAPAAPSAAPPSEAADFSDVFGDLGTPDAKAVPVSGAVDIRKITPPRPEPRPVTPPKPVHPSRIWVQVGVGRDKSALGFTWRRIAKGNPELFDGKSAAIADWGRTNRLLTGPFESAASANAFLAKLKREKIDAFVWTSPAGQVVDPLRAK